MKVTFSLKKDGAFARNKNQCQGNRASIKPTRPEPSLIPTKVPIPAAIIKMFEGFYYRVAFQGGFLHGDNPMDSLSELAVRRSLSKLLPDPVNPFRVLLAQRKIIILNL